MDNKILNEHKAIVSTDQLKMKMNINIEENFKLFDDVFFDFAKTAILLGKKRDFQEILQRTLDYSGLSYYKFYHNSTPYIAEVSRFDFVDMEMVTKWVHIKLPINGYININAENKGGRYYIHDAKFCFDKTREILEDKYNEFKVFYTVDTKSLDLKFYPSYENNPAIMLTFEHGYPYVDDIFPWIEI